MSWISAQCDQLRERAKELCSLAPDPAVPYLVPSTKETMALAMRSAASEMEDAANTIWELRCKLVDIVADLQEALAENAKLRELVRDLYEMAYPECPSAFEAAFSDRMRELGIEVDG